MERLATWCTLQVGYFVIFVMKDTLGARASVNLDRCGIDSAIKKISLRGYFNPKYLHISDIE